jgi:hypothetical protein
MILWLKWFYIRFFMNVNFLSWKMSAKKCQILTARSVKEITKMEATSSLNVSSPSKSRTCWSWRTGDRAWLHNFQPWMQSQSSYRRKRRWLPWWSSLCGLCGQTGTLSGKKAKADELRNLHGQSEFMLTRLLSLRVLRSHRDRYQEWNEASHRRDFWSLTVMPRSYRKPGLGAGDFWFVTTMEMWWWRVEGRSTTC